MFYISKHSHLAHAQIPQNMRSETRQTTIKETQVRSYLLSASNPPAQTQACTLMASILSLSLRIVLMKSALARRWLSSVS